METIQKPFDMITDFVTGKPMPNVGAEETRQKIEKFLVEQKGYDKTDIEVDAPIEVMFKDEPYLSAVSMVIHLEGTRFMAIKCVAGSIESWEREILAAARVMEKNYQIPFAAVTDGKTAHLIDTLSGKCVSKGLESIFSKPEAARKLKELTLSPLDNKRRRKEQIIFRSYDLENVNVKRNIQ